MYSVTCATRCFHVHSAHFKHTSCNCEQLHSMMAPESCHHFVRLIGSVIAQVYSAFRLAKAAKDAGAQVAAVCVGPTRADGFLDLKVRWWYEGAVTAAAA